MKIGTGVGVEYIRQNGGIATPLYATYNPARVAANISLSNGNQTATKSGSGGTFGHFGGTAPKTTGKWAYRARAAVNNNGQFHGVCAGASDGAFPEVPFWDADSPRFTHAIAWYQTDATVAINFAGARSTEGSSQNGDLSSSNPAQWVEILLDLDSATNTFKVAKGGTVFYTKNLPSGLTWTPFGVCVFATSATIDAGGGGYTVSAGVSALGYQAWAE